MRRRIAFAFAAAFVAAAAVAAWLAAAPRGVSAEVASAVSEPGDPEAGRNVFFIAGCESCHMSPGQKDPFRLGGGMELKTPFGSFYPPNISPDRADGIGGMERGRVRRRPHGGRVEAGRASLSGLPLPLLSPHVGRGRPQPLRLPAHAAAGFRACAGECAQFPFSFRRAVGFWKLLYMPKIEHPLAADPTDEEALGRYLVQGPGHCAECHSPRDFLGGIIASRRLTGGPLPEGKGKAPNITAEGLKDWSEDDIETALSTGFTPSGDVLGGPMALEVGSLSKRPRRRPRRDRPLPEELSRAVESLRNA